MRLKIVRSNDFRSNDARSNRSHRLVAVMLEERHDAGGDVDGLPLLSPITGYVAQADSGHCLQNVDELYVGGESLDDVVQNRLVVGDA